MAYILTAVEQKYILMKKKENLSNNMELEDVIKKSKWTTIRKMPSKEILERFLDGKYSDRGGVEVYFDEEKGEFIE